MEAQLVLVMSNKLAQLGLQKRQLPSKESSLFKELLDFYERKSIKKGIKTADAILKKFPEHGGMYSNMSCRI